MKKLSSKLLAALAATTVVVTSAHADQPKFKADPPASILTPDEVQTSVGTLHFRDGAPDDKSVQLALDQLLLGRSIETFLKGIPATSVWAACNGLASAGVKENQGVGLTLVTAFILAALSACRPGAGATPRCGRRRPPRSCHR